MDRRHPPQFRQRLRRGLLSPWPVAALVAAVYVPGLTGRWIPFFRDTLSHQLGWRLQWMHQIRAWQLPLWNPDLLGGSALLANPNTMSLYPGTALFLLLPPPLALGVHLLAHHLLVTFGGWFLLRRLAVSRRACLVGTLVLACGGLTFSQSAFANAAAAFAWAPWILASAVRWPTRPGPAWRRAAGSGAFGALQWLAGEPAVALITWAAWACVLAGSLIGSRRRAASVAIAAAAPVLAVGLAAPLLLPATSLADCSWRAAAGTSAAAVAADAFLPRRWPELVLPHLFGQPSRAGVDGFWAAPSFGWLRYELSLHIGTVGLILAALGIRRRRLRWACLVVAAGALAALPGVLIAARTVVEPLSQFRYAIKLLLAAQLGMAPLVAWGLVRVRARPRTFRRSAVAVAVGLVPVGLIALDPQSVGAALSALYPASADNLALPGVAEAVAMRLRTDVLLAAVPLLLAAWRPRELLLPALALQLVAGGLWAVQWDRWDAWSTRPELMKVLETDPRALDVRTVGSSRLEVPTRAVPPDVRGHYRRLRQSLVPFYGERWGLSYRGARGPDGTEPYWLTLLAGRFESAPAEELPCAARHIGAGWVLADTPLPPGPCHRLHGTRDNRGKSFVLHRTRVTTPDAWIAERVSVVGSELAAWRQLVDPRTRPGRDGVVITRQPASTISSTGGLCRLVDRRPGDWTVHTATAGPGLLVIDQAFSPRWRVEIDGARVQALRVNMWAVGTRVPAGEHTVQLAVGAGRFYRGVVVAALVVLVILLPTVRRRRRPPNGAGARSRPANPPAPSP